MGSAGPYLFSESPTWTAIFFGSYIVVFLLIMRVAVRERDGVRGENRDRGSRAFIYLMSFAALGLAFMGPFVVPAARIGLPQAPVFAVAIALMWAGALLYSWAALTLGQWFRTTVQLLDGQRLVREGPYRLVRHPAYTGGILIFAGIGLATGNWFSFLAATILVTIAYVRRIQVEEMALKERFGAEFEDHRKNTWAVIPPLW